MENQEPAQQETCSNEEQPKKLTIEEIFSDKRMKWKSDILDTVEKLKEMSSLTLGQTQAYSQRHLCVDEIHYLMDIWNKLNEKYKNEKYIVRIALQGGADSRYSKDINEEIDSKTSSIKKQLDVINSQMDFYKETIKTLDQMLYGIKYRLDYENNWNRMS